MNISSTPNKLAVNFTFMVIYLAGLSAFGSFVNDLYLPSLPMMTKDFHCSVPMVQLGLTMGMIGLGLGQIILGPVSDKYGRKIVLICSMSLFIVGATVSLFSPTIHFFLGCRFIQGLGASGGYFLARSIPADLYSGRQLAKTMAVIGAINGFAPASAPVIGGFISDRFGWQGDFVFLALFALLLLCFASRLKESLPEANRAKGTLWKAFVDYRLLLTNRPFMTHVMLKGTALGILFAYISSAPFIIQTHYGFSQIHFGLFMGLNALFVAAGSMLALRFQVLKRAAFIGALMLLGAIFAECVVLWRVDDFWCYELILWPVMVALGMIFTVSNTLSMNEGKADAGRASAVLGVSGYLFGAIVSPVVGLGNMMHSTAIVFGILALLVMVCALLSRRLPADLNQNETSPTTKA